MEPNKVIAVFYMDFTRRNGTPGHVVLEILPFDAKIYEKRGMTKRELIGFKEEYKKLLDKYKWVKYHIRWVGSDLRCN